MAGRNPQAAAIKVLTGRGDGKDSAGREIQMPVEFPAECPDAPAWLPRYAAEEWERVGPMLAQRKMLKAADRAAFTAYCLAWDRLVCAYELQLDPDDFDPASSRRIEIERESASKELRQWAVQFGLTPVSGVKLIPPSTPKPEDDPFV